MTEDGMKSLKLVCCAIFLGLLCVPIAQCALKLAPRQKVVGIAIPDAPAAPTFPVVASGDFQKQFELWFERGNGLWEYFVRFDNQISWDLFQQASSSYVTQVFLGRGINLFQRIYLDDFNRAQPLPIETLERRVRLLRAAQDALAKRGVQMLLVISAPHIRINPAIVSPGYISPNRETRADNYERMLPLLDAAGINYFDSVQFFKKENEAGRLHFLASASHYDNVGACLVTQQILARAENLLGKKLAKLSCDPIARRNEPKAVEIDLASISNLWDADLYNVPTEYPTVKMERSPESYQPSVLFVGTSFVYALLEMLERKGAVKRTDFFYYYKEHRHFPGGKQRPLDRTSIDWKTFFDKRDLVVIECSSAVLPEAGFHFVVDVAEQLG